MRFLAYAGISSVLAGAVVGIAAIERPNFYSACIAISNSGLSVIILLNVVVILTILFGRGLQLCLFGQLRALELDHLYEQTWYTLTEAFLTMTMFRDGFNVEFLGYFCLSLFLRVFHWISRDRVDLIFQTATPPSLLAKLRLAFALGLFWVCDFMLLRMCLKRLFNSFGTFIMFTFEFALLHNNIVTSIGKYLLNLAEQKYLSEHEDEDTWESKGMWMYILEIVTDFTRLVIYAAQFVFMLKPFGLPVHIVRDVYISAASFVGRVRDFSRFLHARQQMDQQIADAREEDLVRDNICIVCREDMEIIQGQSRRSVPKRLSCGHVIHHGCLKSWLERSQRCPTCRTPVFGTDPNHTPWNIPRANANNNAQNNANGNAVANRNHNGNGTGAPVGHSQSQGNGSNASTRATGTVNDLPTNAIVFERDVTLPTGWTALRSRITPEGVQQIQLNEDTWATVVSNPAQPQRQPSPTVGATPTTSGPSTSTTYSTLRSQDQSASDSIQMMFSQLEDRVKSALATDNQHSEGEIRQLRTMFSQLEQQLRTVEAQQVSLQNRLQRIEDRLNHQEQ